MEVRWVFVHDLTGTHRDEYFFTTDVGMSAQEVIETYVGRWNEETTFQEMRSYLGLETTRGWKEKTVLRGALPVRGVHGGGVLVQPVAPAVRRSAGGGLGGEERRDVLRRHHRRKALAVGGMGFCNPRLPGGL